MDAIGAQSCAPTMATRPSHRRAAGSAGWGWHVAEAGVDAASRLSSPAAAHGAEPRRRRLAFLAPADAACDLRGRLGRMPMSYFPAATFCARRMASLSPLQEKAMTSRNPAGDGSHPELPCSEGVMPWLMRAACWPFLAAILSSMIDGEASSKTCLGRQNCGRDDSKCSMSSKDIEGGGEDARTDRLAWKPTSLLGETGWRNGESTQTRCDGSPREDGEWIKSLLSHSGVVSRADMREPIGPSGSIAGRWSDVEEGRAYETILGCLYYP